MFFRTAQQSFREPSHEVLQQLNRLERTSADFPHQLTNLLSLFSKEEYYDPSFPESVLGEDRAWLIEYLDNVRVYFTVPTLC